MSESSKAEKSSKPAVLKPGKRKRQKSADPPCVRITRRHTSVISEPEEEEEETSDLNRSGAFGFVYQRPNMPSPKDNSEKFDSFKPGSRAGSAKSGTVDFQVQRIQEKKAMEDMNKKYMDQMRKLFDEKLTPVNDRQKATEDRVEEVKTILEDKIDLEVSGLKKEMNEKLSTIDTNVGIAIKEALKGHVGQRSPKAAKATPTRPFNPNTMKDGIIDYSNAQRIERENDEATKELIVYDIKMSKNDDPEISKKEDEAELAKFFKLALAGQTEVKAVYNSEEKAHNNIKFIRRHGKSANYTGDPKNPRPISVYFFERDTPANIIRIANLNGKRNIKRQIPKQYRQMNEEARQEVVRLNEIVSPGWYFRLEGGGLKYIKMVRTEKGKQEDIINGPAARPNLFAGGLQDPKDSDPEEIDQQMKILEQKVRDADTHRLQTEARMNQMKAILKIVDPTNPLLQQKM